MKLDWRTTSDGERWFANVDDGQLIVTYSPILRNWRIDLFLIPDNELRSLAFDKFARSNDFLLPQDAMVAVETWYSSTRSGT